MSPSGKKKHQESVSAEPSSQTAAMENFVRLQEHQAEYLKWLEASERSPEMDRYNYKKIR